mgnify:CR=1 FL=1
MEGGFDFWTEALKEVIGAAAGALLPVLGAFVALWRGGVEARRQKAEAQARDAAARHRQLEDEVRARRERYVLETLVSAYQRLENAWLRQVDWVSEDPELQRKIQLEFERALAHIQLLADRENALKAQALCLEPDPMARMERFRDLVISLRRELRDRLDLKAVEADPASLRVFPDAVVLRTPDEVLEAIGGPAFVAHKRGLGGARAGAPGTA